MAIVALTPGAWTQINTVARRIQVRGGRILVADSITPVDNDWFFMGKDSFADFTGIKFAKAFDSASTVFVVTQAP